MRALRFLIGLLLLPVIWAIVVTAKVIMSGFFVGSFPYLSWSLLALMAGYFVFLLIFLFFKIPPVIYVFGHELTHALWGLMTFSKIGKIKVSSKGGSCVVSNPGIMTTLAPYFVPFYLVVLVAIRLIVGLIWDMSEYELWWLGGIGFTYGFHLTFTVKALTEVAQSDIAEYGKFFSCVLIILLNLFILEIGLAVNASVSFMWYFSNLFENIIMTYREIWELVMNARA